MLSGLYDSLISHNLLVPHEEAPLQEAFGPEAYRVLRPRPATFVSYPYEWSFGQLKDAALLTLEVQRRALEHGMILKDASAYNVVFDEGRPLFIDTLSFDLYEQKQPWVAYRQFCQHFLAPLLLMSNVDIRFGKESAVHLDGLPLDLASQLLPRSSWLRPSYLVHVHLHARSIRHFGPRAAKSRLLERGVSPRGLEALLASLESVIRRASWKHQRTEWTDYEHQHAYGEKGFAAKRLLVSEMLGRCRADTLWDLGANVGIFSRIAAEAGARVLSIDGDPGAVETNYQKLKTDNDTRILPLWIDLSNPSPALGWAHAERLSLAERGPADALLALALVHHLAITNNVPFSDQAAWMASLGRTLIIEYVPKTDPQAQRLLVSRKDVFADYNRDAFEGQFTKYFSVLKRVEIPDTGRTLYLMESTAPLPGRGCGDGG